MMTSRDFLGDDFYLSCLKDYEGLRSFRHSIKGKPDMYEQIVLDMNKGWERFYRRILGYSE